MKRQLLTILLAVLLLSCWNLTISERAHGAEFTTKIFRAAAIGLAVDAAAPQLDKFIRTVTFNNGVPVGTATKVVPILSVGEKGYVGAAQIAGPDSYVKSTKAVWLYEDNFSNNEFRLKVYVPTSSLNPLELKRTQKVGISAIIDVSLDGRWKGQTISRGVGPGEILKAGVVAIAINAAADPLNKAINSITKGLDSNTKVVPIATIGDKAYIGGVQVSGPSKEVKAVKTCYQYEEIFDDGKFRIKIFVPSDSTSPLKIKRIAGVGVTALIDTSIADQQRIRERQADWYRLKPIYHPLEDVLGNRFRSDIITTERHDQGLHKGWYIGKGNLRKRITGIWVDRYQALDPKDREDFVVWWNIHYKDKPEELEARWREWIRTREELREKARYRLENDEEREKAKGKSNNKEKGVGKGKKN
ncbi:MAG: hypothetical protein QHH26_05565 [Armatimonadota bacterium]|nr:hypothetical protein [Armatimonadota bacterium]